MSAVVWSQIGLRDGICGPFDHAFGIMSWLLENRELPENLKTEGEILRDDWWKYTTAKHLQDQEKEKNEKKQLASALQKVDEITNE